MAQASGYRSRRTVRPAPPAVGRPPWRIVGLPQRHLSAFVADRCRADPSALVRSSVLRKAYRRWCLEFGLEPMTDTMFGATLAGLGFAHSRTATYRGWRGLTVG